MGLPSARRNSERLAYVIDDMLVVGEADSAGVSCVALGGDDGARSESTCGHLFGSGIYFSAVLYGSRGQPGHPKWSPPCKSHRSRQQDTRWPELQCLHASDKGVCFRGEVHSKSRRAHDV